MAGFTTNTVPKASAAAGLTDSSLDIDANNNVTNATAALATTATDGFFYLTTSAGAPTGTPTTKTGQVALHYDTTNSTLYVYNGSWKSAAGSFSGPGTSTDNAAVRFSGTDGTIGQDSSLIIDDNANVVLGTAALATTATDGFLYVTTSAGPPTGTPTTKTGQVAVHYDTTNDNLYVYNGSWQTTGAGIANVVEDLTPQSGGDWDTNDKQINYDTGLIIQQQLDSTLADVLLFDSVAAAELIASSGIQTFLAVKPEINQSASAGYTALEVDALETAIGAGDNNLLDLLVSGVSKFCISNAGDVVVVGFVDGRDMALDGAKLDGIESSSDATDATNVAAAGAVMDGDYSANGMNVRTGAGAYTNRSVAATANETTVADGDGVSGDPTVGIADDPIIPGTGGIEIPQGTTAQRLANDGALRVNTTTGTTEIYRSAAWRDLEAGSDTNAVGGWKYAVSSLWSTESAVPGIEQFSGATTLETIVAAFPDTTDEFKNYADIIDIDIDTSGTVTFRAFVWAKTAAADKNIRLMFSHRAISDSESVEGTYTDEETADQIIDATQDDVTEVTWTETVSNLGWTGGEQCFWRFKRSAVSGAELVGDLYVSTFAVEIPRA